MCKRQTLCCTLKIPVTWEVEAEVPLPGSRLAQVKLVRPCPKNKRAGGVAR
jgi:hypothetical protein